MSLLDFNFNFNAGIVPPLASGQRSRPRFNSDVTAKLVDATQPVVPPAAPGTFHYPPYPTYWDAELHAAMYLDRFLDHVFKKYPATLADPARTWRSEYAIVARAAGTPPREMTEAALNGEILGMLDLALEREDRFAEILDQDDADGVMNYWLGMLKIDPARNRAANLMVRVGRRVGEHVAMCLKGDFLCPRPSQISPAVTPMFDPPTTPSFPAGHAVQAHLISFLLADAMPHLPQNKIPPQLGSTEADWLNATGLLFDLATRVSQNRVIAGVHYPVDITAGKSIAARAFIDLREVAEVAALNADVKNEFPQYN
jgi:hypothetical protein